MSKVSCAVYCYKQNTQGSFEKGEMVLFMSIIQNLDIWDEVFSLPKQVNTVVGYQQT